MLASHLLQVCVVFRLVKMSHTNTPTPQPKFGTIGVDSITRVCCKCKVCTWIRSTSAGVQSLRYCSCHYRFMATLFFRSLTSNSDCMDLKRSISSVNYHCQNNNFVWLVVIEGYWNKLKTRRICYSGNAV